MRLAKFFLLFLALACINWAPLIIYSGMPPAADPCTTAGCTGTYDACWTGDYPGDSGIICLNSGASTQADESTVDVTIDEAYGVSGNGIRVTTVNDYIRWQITDTTGPITDYLFNDSIGTMCADVKPISVADVNQMVEITEDTMDWSNYFSFRIDAEGVGASDDDLRIEHEGQGNNTTNDGPDDVNSGSWVTLCVSWDVANGKVSQKVGASAWQEDTGLTMATFADGTYYFVIGEKGRDIGQEEYYLDNYKFKGGAGSYQYAF